MSSFGRWYDEQKSGESDEEMGGLLGFAGMSAPTTDQLMSTFNIDNLPNASSFSFENMKQSMEAQLPQKVLGMNYQERFRVFCALLVLSALLFALAFFVGLPLIAARPQKFALSFTCGSLTFMGSFGILKGPYEHISGMCASDRRIFTATYLASMAATLYFTFTHGGINGYLLVLSSSAVQLVALLWYLISFLPGGAMGLKIVLRAVCTMLQPILAGCMRCQAMCIQQCMGCLMRR